MIHFPGCSSVDYNFRVAIVDQDCANVEVFILKSRSRTYDSRTRVEIGLIFCFMEQKEFQQMYMPEKVGFL